MPGIRFRVVGWFHRGSWSPPITAPLLGNSPSNSPSNQLLGILRLWVHLVGKQGERLHKIAYDDGHVMWHDMADLRFSKLDDAAAWLATVVGAVATAVAITVGDAAVLAAVATTVVAIGGAAATVEQPKAGRSCSRFFRFACYKLV